MSRRERRATRQRCHGSRWCCQYCDTPMCNSAKDPHLVARVVYRWHQWKAMQP